MSTKQEILSELQEGLTTGVISDAEVRAVLSPPEKSSDVVSDTRSVATSFKSEKLSAVDIMFYIAGIVLFSALMSMIGQTWNDGSRIMHVLLSAGVGVGFWAVAYYLIRSGRQSDIRHGLINSLLLTGALSIIAGSYITTNELLHGFDRVDFIPIAVALAVVAAMHLAYDRLVKRDLILLLGVLVGVAAFTCLMFGFLQEAHANADFWEFVLIVAAGLLAYAPRVAAKVYPERARFAKAFDGFAAFVALASMYAAGFGDHGVIWTVVLIVTIVGFFYLSILMQSKYLLGNGTFFLVLSVITISFKYFSGFGVTTCLILSAAGLLGTAVAAATINKKYFHQSAEVPPSPHKLEEQPVQRAVAPSTAPELPDTAADSGNNSPKPDSK